jgi:hypothetical protein
MNTSNNNVSVSTEVERLESERLIGESLVATTRDRYASEIGNAGEIERMLKYASVKPKTYALPKRLKKRRDGNGFIQKLKKLFGL